MRVTVTVGVGVGKAVGVGVVGVVGVVGAVGVVGVVGVGVVVPTIITRATVTGGVKTKALKIIGMDLRLLRHFRGHFAGHFAGQFFPSVAWLGSTKTGS